MSDDLQEYEDLLHEKLKRKRSHLNRIPSQDFECEDNRQKEQESIWVPLYQRLGDKIYDIK